MNQDEWNEWWLQDCPARGVNLRHRRTIEDPPGMCAECGRVPEVPGEFAAHFPDHNCEPLRNAVGLCVVCGKYVPMPGILGEIDPSRVDDIKREPKLATGEVTGSRWGRGRGNVTFRMERNLVFNCLIVREGDESGAGDTDPPMGDIEEWLDA